MSRRRRSRRRWQWQNIRTVVIAVVVGLGAVAAAAADAVWTAESMAERPRPPTSSVSQRQWHHGGSHHDVRN